MRAGLSQGVSMSKHVGVMILSLLVRLGVTGMLYINQWCDTADL